MFISFKAAGEDGISNLVFREGILNKDGSLELEEMGRVVALPETGYRVKIDLVHFKLLEQEDIEGYHCSILGYFYFEEILAESRRKQRGIYRKRVESYYNSRLHFCRSLYKNQLH